jgi:3-isopropylmalate/(R)-2-methylmalate dehydratase small subunit
MTAQNLKIQTVAGTGVPVTGNDIDTDRIIPARYLKEITFANMGKYPFYDERFDEAGHPKGHPFDNPAYQGASVLLVNQNFGCGSSREHAPQSLMRWGVKAVVGESFAEIFAGNCTMLGIPLVTVTPEAAATLQALVQKAPKTRLTVDLEKKQVLIEGGLAVPFQMPEPKRQALMGGTWDSTGLLLANAAKTAETAKRLPYVSGF